MCSSKERIKGGGKAYHFPLLIGDRMTDKDFKNINDIQRMLKYLDKGKLDYQAWPNALEIKQSLDRLLEEHKEYMNHMKHHH